MRQNMKKENIIKVVVGVVVVAVVFFGGMEYGLKKVSGGNNFSQNGGNRNRQFQGGGMGMRGQGAGFTSGKIIAKDANSITVSLRDGGSKIIFFSPTTSISKSVEGTSTDLTTDTNVLVSGPSNTDGSINAQSIRIGDFGTSTPSAK